MNINDLLAWEQELERCLKQANLLEDNNLEAYNVASRKREVLDAKMKVVRRLIAKRRRKNKEEDNE